MIQRTLRRLAALALLVGGLTLVVGAPALAVSTQPTPAPSSTNQVTGSNTNPGLQVAPVRSTAPTRRTTEPAVGDIDDGMLTDQQNGDGTGNGYGENGRPTPFDGVDFSQFGAIFQMVPPGVLGLAFIALLLAIALRRSGNQPPK